MRTIAIFDKKTIMKMQIALHVKQLERLSLRMEK